MSAAPEDELLLLREIYMHNIESGKLHHSTGSWGLQSNRSPPAAISPFPLGWPKHCKLCLYSIFHFQTISLLNILFISVSFWRFFPSVEFLDILNVIILLLSLLHWSLAALTFLSTVSCSAFKRLSLAFGAFSARQVQALS